MLYTLAEMFQVTINQIGQCYRIEESDIFLYEENPDEYYVTFMNEMAEVSDYSSSRNRDERISPT